MAAAVRAVGRSTRDFFFFFFFSLFIVIPKSKSIVQRGQGFPGSQWESNHTSRPDPNHPGEDEGPNPWASPTGWTRRRSHTQPKIQQGAALKLFLFGDRILSILRGRHAGPDRTGLGDSHMQVATLPAHR